jgi:hypothetical protein
MLITKVKFCGLLDKTFCDVSFKDIKIIDDRLYVRDNYIPIRENLVKYAYAEFIKGINSSGYKYYYLYFKLLPDKKFLSRYTRHNNTLALIFNNANDFGREEKWYCPYWDEELLEYHW